MVKLLNIDLTFTIKYMLSPKLIFDIETVGVEFDSLDDNAKEFLRNLTDTTSQ